ncbi:putative BPI/LBP family protein [Citrus sinensis]|nr:putative BPI/LBP family protein [Citrus sinensis]
MKILSKILPLLLLLITSSFFSSQAQVGASNQESFTSIIISQTGLDFVKDLLITKAISSIIPLALPKIERAVKIPILGNVRMVLSNITIYNIDVLSSYVKPGDTGVVFVAYGTTCNLSANWFYEYTTWLLPIEISDHGIASVQGTETILELISVFTILLACGCREKGKFDVVLLLVKVEGMQVGLTLGLETQKGTLKLSLVDCGCYVKDISIKLDGGASWLYQGMINAFEEQIVSAVENAITKKLKEGISKLDSLLQSLPKEIPVDDHASLNITFVDNPLLTSSSIEFDINGLFTARKKASIPNYYNSNLQPPVFCSDQSKMLGISLDETVLNSASALYYDAEFMQWTVDKVPDQSLLNTAGWRFIIPQLYRKYPNDDMNLNISLSSPPVIRVAEDNIDATVHADLIIDVLESGEVIPVACISLPVVWAVIQTVFVPYVNSHLGQGFPLPIIHGFTVKSAEIICSSSKITVCSDVAYADSHNLNQIFIPFSNRYT